MRRSAGFVSIDAHQFRTIIFDRSHHALLLLVPPFVVGNAVAIAVSAGKKRGVSWSRTRIGVVVITVWKVGAVIEKKAEARVSELVAVAFQIITPKLVNHDHHNKLGMGVVSGSKAADRQGDERRQPRQQKTEVRGGRSWGRPHREGSLHVGKNTPKLLRSSESL